MQEDLDKEASSSPNGSNGDVSTSVNEPLTALEKTSTTTVSTAKGKVRVSFSERQMNALVQRFNVQKYLSPAEMKNLSEMIGLSYKQVRGLIKVVGSHAQKIKYVHFLKTENLL